MPHPIVLWYKKAKNNYENIDSFPDNTKRGVYVDYVFAKEAFEVLMENISSKFIGE